MWKLVNVCVRWIRVGPTHGTSMVTKTGWQNGLYDCGPETAAFQSHFQCLLHRHLLGSKYIYIYVFVGPPYNLARYPFHVGASDSACSTNSDDHSSSFCGPIKSDVDDPSISLLPNSHSNSLFTVYFNSISPQKKTH